MSQIKINLFNIRYKVVVFDGQKDKSTDISQSPAPHRFLSCEEETRKLHCAARSFYNPIIKIRLLRDRVNTNKCLWATQILNRQMISIIYTFYISCRL